MSEPRFFVAGPCWKCGLGCEQWDNAPASEAPVPALHDGCACYIAEARTPELPPLTASCRSCATSQDRQVRRKADRLLVAILGDRMTIEVTCPRHGLVGRWRLEKRVEEGCELCGEGETCRH